MRPKCYIISLDREPGRRKRSIAEAEIAGLDWEVVPAVDGREYKSRTGVPLWGKMKAAGMKFNNGAWGTSFTASEVAIYQSHMETYRRILASGADWAIILEDDFALKGAPYGFDEVIEELNNLPPHPTAGKWLYCTLHNEVLEYTPNAKPIERVSPILDRMSEIQLVSVGYAISKELCALFLDKHSTMIAPHDHQMCAVSRNPDLLFLKTTYPLCRQSGAYTTQV